MEHQAVQAGLLVGLSREGLETAVMRGYLELAAPAEL
jgi:hypothetical protein